MAGRTVRGAGSPGTIGVREAGEVRLHDESAAGPGADAQFAADGSGPFPHPGQSVTGQSVTGQSVTGQSMTGQSMTGQSMTGQSVTGQSVTGQSVTGQSVTG